MKTERRSSATLLSYAQLAILSRWALVGLAVPILPLLDWLGWLGPAFLPLVALTGIAAGYNLAQHLLLRRWSRRGRVPRRRLEAARRAASLADLTILVGVIYLTGGPHSPFYALFLLAFVFLGLAGRTTEPLLYGVLVLTLLALMFAAEHARIVPHFGFGPGGRGPGDEVPDPPLLAGILAYWTLLTVAAFVLVHLVRREIRDRELRLVERRRQLAEAEAFQTRVLEYLPVGIVVFGAGGRISRLNPVAAELLEAGSELQNLLRMPRMVDSGLSGFVERLVGGEPLVLDSFPCVVAGRGRPLWLRLRGVPPRRADDGHEEPGILLIEDISTLKERDDREAALQEQLFQADKLSSLGQLASGVAHELNNPLTAILGTAQLVGYMLREGHGDPGELEKRLEHIQVHGKRIESLIRSLLTYARPSREEPRRIPLKTLVDELLVFSEFEIKRDGVELVVDVAPGLPDFLCAKTELQQLMLNLLTNARHVVPRDGSGRIGLSLSLQPRAAGQRLLRIEVRDNGPGIPGDVIERIFEPFFSTKDPSQGTGLGLAIVNAIVERYRGVIHIETEPGAGTAFIVELPYHDELPAGTGIGDATFSPYG